MIKPFKIQIYDELNSTNTLAKNNIVSNQIDANYINAYLAINQSAGVGKLGRKWYSSAGNLHLSYVLKINDYMESIADLGLISLLVGIVIKDTIVDIIKQSNGELFNNHNIKLKWPNDVLLNNKKIAGILLETEQNTSQTSFLVIGIGVNLLSYPQDLEATSLRDVYNLEIKPEIFAQKFLENFFNELYNNINNNQGRLNQQSIMNKWYEVAFGLNQKVRIIRNNQEVVGTFKGLNNKGHMLLQDEQNQSLEITTRDVFNLH